MVKADKNVIMEDFKRAFQRINEYTVSTGLNVDEAGDSDEQQSDDNAAPVPQANGPMDGPMPDANNGAAPMGSADAGEAPMASDTENPQDGGTTLPQGLNPQDGGAEANGEPMPDMGQMDGESQEQPDDTVIDVSDITDSQKDIEAEISQVNDKYEKVVKALGAFETLLKQSNEKIEDLKGEYEKRNPTQVEKLSMQTAHSYPFNITPEEYWKDKEATSNYRTEDDDNGKEQGQYVITKNDVNGATDWKNIADSLDDNKVMYHQNLNNLFNY